MSIGTIQTDQLFKGLTRPAMILGVTFTFAIFNLLISVLTFIYSNDLRVLFFLGPGIHMLGFIASSKEPLFIEIFMIKLQKCSRCLNRFYHGANSYDII
ncbi:type IV secretion system protein VirB3 [Wolbachia endosymbiont of Pentidionis agamae]|uniref:type IV secretion system protein VirB3 n=1 Tax=Wolbachia endosymbiont of Pentidionis agamae TaxID=3110435 RepID=UPI002FD47F3D